MNRRISDAALAWFRCGACAVMLLALGTLSMQAQTPLGGMSSMMLGGGLHYLVGLQSADVPVYSGQPDCGTFSDGSGRGFAIDGRFIMPALFAPSFGIDARLRFASSSAELTTPPVEPTNVRDESGSMVSLEREYRIEQSLATFGTDLLVRYDIEPVVVSAGLAIGFNVSSELTATDNIVGPGDYRFPDGQSSRDMTPGGGDVSSVAFQPMVTLSLPLHVGATIHLVPELAGRFGVASSLSDATWNTTELTFGLGVLFDIAGTSTPIAPVPGVGR